MFLELHTCIYNLTQWRQRRRVQGLLDNPFIICFRTFQLFRSSVGIITSKGSRTESRAGSRSPKYWQRGHFVILFCRGPQRNYRVTWYTLLIKRFAWRCSRCGCRRGLRKAHLKNWTTSRTFPCMSHIRGYPSDVPREARERTRITNSLNAAWYLHTGRSK